MGKGYFSSRESDNKRKKAITEIRLKNRLCVSCGQPLNHSKRRCDYCVLRHDILYLKRLLHRLAKYVSTYEYERAVKEAKRLGLEKSG